MKTKYLLKFGAAIASVLLSTASVRAQDVMVNGGFVAATNNTDWIISGTAAIIVQYPDRSSDGDGWWGYLLAGNAKDGTIYQVVNVTPGTPYTFAYDYCKNGTPNPNAYVDIFSGSVSAADYATYPVGSGSVYSVTNSATTAYPTYKTQTAVFTPATSQVTIRFSDTQNSTSSGVDLYVDNVRLIKGLVAWKGTTSANTWDTTPGNTVWLSDTSSVAAPFANANYVTFNGLAATNVVEIPGTVSPSTIVVNNTAANPTNAVTFEGTGSIAGTTTALQKRGAGLLTITTTNTFGGPVIISGSVSINSLKNADGSASALGAPTDSTNGTIKLGLTATAGTLIYTGTGDTSDRIIDMTGAAVSSGNPPQPGATLNNQGTGLLKFTSDFAASLSGASTGTKTLTLNNTPSGPGEIAGAIPDSAYTTFSGTAFASSLRKVVVNMIGTGTWTLSGTNTYTGGTTISSGTLRLGDGVSRNGVVAGNITDNATLEFATPADQTYSGVISGTGTLVKSGAGMLTLDNTETYSGGTVISNGTLLVSGSLAGGTVTVQTNGILGGAGIIGGNVAVYGTLAPGIVTPGTTMNITSNLDLSVGGSLSLNVSDIYYFGSDQVNVGTLMAGGTLKLTALSGSADLDTNADYILLTAATSIVGTFNISPAWQGTPPANAANFIIQNSGNNVVLHYASVLPPTVTASANPDTTGRYQTITVTAVVAPGDGAITSVTVDASSIGGSSTASLVLSNANVYTNSFTVSPATTLGLTTLLVTVTDANALTGTYPVGLTVVPTLETWNGAGSDDNWSTAANWTNGYAPLTGDLVFFDGSTRTSPILETGYTVAGVTFDSGAAAFTLGGSGSTLTLAEGVTNHSAYPQTVSVPIQLPNANRATFNTASNDMILANDIYDGGYGLFTTGGHALILTSPTLSYNGNMTIDNASTLEVGGSGQLDAGNYGGQITNRGTFLYSSSADQTLVGGMTGVGGLTKTNSSTLYLVANNTYSGTNQINAGTVNVGNGGTTGSLGTGPIENNGTLTVNLGAPTIFNFPAGGTTGSGTISATAETILFNGSVTSGGSQNYTSTSTGITPSNRGLRFPVNGTALVATNGSSITLSGDSGCNTNSRRGTLTIDTSSGNGTVNLDISIGWQKFLYPYNQLTVDAGTGAINVSGPHSTNGWNNIPVSLSGAVDITADILSLGNNLTINATAPSSMSGILSGPAKLVKDGPADLVITNIQAYTGTTTVSNGTLLVNGSLDSGSAVTVEGGTLGGNGSIGGSVTVNGGELSPGASIGALTINSNLILNAGSTSTFEVNADTPTNDIIVLGDTVTYGGTLNIVATGTFSLGQTFTLFSGAGATNASNFASITGSPGTGLAFSFANGLLSVVNAIVAPVTLTNSISGNTLTLTWPAGQGWVLQSQTNNLSTGLQVNPGTWGTVPGDGSASIIINPANPTVFYRLVH